MDGFRFTIPYDVRVADVNYGAHVSNAAVLSFFQDARIAYLKQFSLSELDIGGCGIILPEAHVNYRAEMFLGDLLRIGVRTELHQNHLLLWCIELSVTASLPPRGQRTLWRLIMSDVSRCVCRRSFDLALNYLRLDWLEQKREFDGL